MVLAGDQLAGPLATAEHHERTAGARAVACSTAVPRSPQDATKAPAVTVLPPAGDRLVRRYIRSPTGTNTPTNGRPSSSVTAVNASLTVRVNNGANRAGPESRALIAGGAVMPRSTGSWVAVTGL